jgi:rhodanese-related sulfurtransferase/DNA-binding HxlR family transcriptional regulator
LNGLVAEHDGKGPLFEGLAEVARALGSGPRLLVLDVLAQGERSVEHLAAATGLSTANASQHLQVLRRAGLVASRREGARVLSRVADEEVVRLVLSLREVAAERVAGVERAARGYLGDEVEAIGRAELAARMAAGEVVVLDVRPRVEFAAGHVQGARSMPLEELEARLEEIPEDAEVVAYCRGPYCVLAHEAVRRLTRSGRRARRLEDGWPEWRLAGLPSATGDEERPSARPRKERTR